MAGVDGFAAVLVLDEVDATKLLELKPLTPWVRFRTARKPLPLLPTVDIAGFVLPNFIINSNRVEM